MNEHEPRQSHSHACLLAVSLCLSPFLAWAAPSPPATPAPLQPLGLTQGEFAVALLEAARGEQLFPRTQTPSSAADKLADIGLAPLGGWDLDAPLTWRVLDSAYLNLLDLLDVADAPGQNRHLAVVSQVSTAAPEAGAPLTWILTAANIGFAPATDATVQLSANGPLYIQPPRDAEAVQRPDSTIWQIDSLDPGETTTIAIEVTTGPEAHGQQLQLAATIADPLPHEKATAASGTSGLIVKKAGLAIADVAVDVSVDNVVPRQGETITYSIVVTNNGPDTAQGVYLTNAIPDALQNPEFSNPAVSNLWIIGELPAGESRGFTVSGEFKTSDPEKIQNLATRITLFHDTADPEPRNNQMESKVLLGFMERVASSVRRAIVPTTTERQPVSPSRPLRR